MATGAGGDVVRFLEGELRRVRQGNPFEILAVPTTADSDAIRQAFLTKTKAHHPNRYARATAEERELATEVFLLIRAAYEQLADETRRKSWLEKLSPPQQAPVASGTEPPKSRQTTQVPAGAAPRAPTRPTGSSPVRRPTVPASSARPTVPAAAYRPTAEVNAMMESAKTRTKRYDDAELLLAQGRYREAREAFFKLASEDPAMKRYRVQLHLSWGLEYHINGKMEEATRELERAIALDPDNAEVVAALQKIGEHKKPGGILSKLFGR